MVALVVGYVCLVVFLGSPLSCSSKESHAYSHFLLFKIFPENTEICHIMHLSLTSIVFLYEVTFIF